MVYVVVSIFFSSYTLMEGPRLIETNFMDHLQSNLKLCHENRTKIYSIILNVGVLVILCLVVGIFLYYRYKGKPSAYELQQKAYKDQQYILDRIRFYQAQQQNLMTSPIGNL